MLALTRHFIPPLSSDFSFSVLCLVGILVSNSNSHKLRVESQKWLCNPVLCAWPQQFQGHTVSSLCLGRGQGILYHNTPTKSNPQHPDLLHPLLCSLFLSPSVSYLGHWCASPAFSAPESSSSHTYVFISLGEQFTSDLDAPILHPHTQHLTTWSSRRFTHAHTHTHTHKPMHCGQWPCGQPTKDAAVCNLGPSVSSAFTNLFTCSFTVTMRWYPLL